MKGEQRIKAEIAVDRVIAMEASADSDAGWHGGSIFARMVENGGMPPTQSSGLPPDIVGNQALFLADWSPEHRQAKEYLDRLTPTLQYALRIDRALRGRTKIVAEDPLDESARKEIHFTDHYIAIKLGITVETLRRRICDGYARLIQIMTGHEKGARRRPIEGVPVSGPGAPDCVQNSH